MSAEMPQQAATDLAPDQLDDLAGRIADRLRAVAETLPYRPASLPLLLGQRAAWEFVGVSRSEWFRLKAADKLPAPVSLDGSRPMWRRADLERYVERLRSARPKRKGPAAEEAG